MKTIIVQNEGNHDRVGPETGSWQTHCRESVRLYAEKMGWDYKVTSYDESFDWYPSRYARGLNQILACYQPSYDYVIQLENDHYIWGLPRWEQASFVTRESYPAFGRTESRVSTPWIAGTQERMNSLVSFVLAQESTSTRDPEVQQLMDSMNENTSDEELFRIWCARETGVKIYPSNRRGAGYTPYTNMYVDWVYRDTIIHLSGRHKQFQWESLQNLMESDDPLALQRMMLYAHPNCLLGDPEKNWTKYPH